MGRRSSRVRCEHCGTVSSTNRYVEVEMGYRLGTCPSCHPNMNVWGKLCATCGAPRVRHGYPNHLTCPKMIERQYIDGEVVDDASLRELR